MNPIPSLGLIFVLSACAPNPSLDAGAAASEASRSASKTVVDSVSIARGAAFADVNCSSCHATGRSGDSTMPTAPRLRELDRRYPVDQLAEAFAEGIVTGHPGMPVFELTRDENRDLIAYLKSIQASQVDGS